MSIAQRHYELFDDDEPKAIGDFLIPDISGKFKWLGSQATDARLRKSPTEVDVEMLRAEREVIISRMADRTGPEVGTLMEELTTVSFVLLAAEADLIDERRSRGELDLH